MQARTIVAVIAVGVTTVALAVIGPDRSARAEPARTESYFRDVPTALAADADGNVWFVAGTSVGRLTPDGDITSYLLDLQAEPTDLVVNAAGVWFTDGRSIGRLSSEGEVTSYRTGLTADPTALTTAPDGTVWFAGDRGRVGVISSTGVITEYVITTAAGNPYLETHDLAVAGDGSVWLSVSEPGEDEYRMLESLVRVSAAGVVLARSPRLNYDAAEEHGERYTSLVRGPDNAVWYLLNYFRYNESALGVVGRLNGSAFGPSWDIPAVSPLAVGSDGALWFGAVSSEAPANLGRLTTAGRLTTFDTGLADWDERYAFIGGPGDRLWVTTSTGIASLTFDGEYAESFSAPYSQPYVESVVAGATTARAVWSIGDATGVTSYSLEVEPGGHRATSTALTATLTGLEVGRSYGLAVRARGPAGTGLPGGTSFTTQPQRAAGPAADFTGDGRAEIAVFRPSNGTWYIRGRASIAYGANGDIPVAGDYTGDGRAEIAVFRPSNGTWYVRGRAPVVYGANGDIPVAGDYTGDGKAEIAVFRPSNGTWYIRGRAAVAYGTTGDIPVPGNYLGDDRADLVVWRPGNQTWYRRGDTAIRFGAVGDRPLILDRNGNGRTELAVYRPSTGDWLTRTGTAFAGNQQLPMPGPFDRKRGDDFAGFDPWDGSWEFSDPEDSSTYVEYGTNGDLPV